MRYFMMIQSVLFRLLHLIPIFVLCLPFCFRCHFRWWKRFCVILWWWSHFTVCIFHAVIVGRYFTHCDVYLFDVFIFIYLHIRATLLHFCCDVVDTTFWYIVRLHYRYIYSNDVVDLHLIILLFQHLHYYILIPLCLLRYDVVRADYSLWYSDAAYSVNLLLRALMLLRAWVHSSTTCYYCVKCTKLLLIWYT